MKLTAKEIPYSSIVGASLALVDDKGVPQLTIMFGGTSWGISQEQSEALCKRIGQLINEHGLEVLPTKENNHEYIRRNGSGSKWRAGCGLPRRKAR